MVEPSSVRAFDEAIAAGRRLGAPACWQIRGTVDLIEDDRIVADGRADDRATIGAQGVKESIEVGGG